MAQAVASFRQVMSSVSSDVEVHTEMVATLRSIFVHGHGSTSISEGFLGSVKKLAGARLIHTVASPTPCLVLPVCSAFLSLQYSTAAPITVSGWRTATPPHPVSHLYWLIPSLVRAAGDESPTRIVVGGYAIGGSLATAFAPWCQLQVRLPCVEASVSPQNHTLLLHQFLLGHSRCQLLRCGASPLRRLQVR